MVNIRLLFTYRYLHIYIYVCRHACSVTQSYLNLLDTMDCSPPCLAVHGIFQPRILEWRDSSSRESSWPRNWTCISCIGRWVLDHCTTFSSVQSLNPVPLFATPLTTVRQASLFITNFWSPPKPMFTVSVMPSNHLILCRPLLLLPSIFPSIRVFSNESALCIRWPSIGVLASTSVPPMNTQDWSLGWTGWISLKSKGLSRVFSNTTVQEHQFFGPQLSL